MRLGAFFVRTGRDSWIALEIEEGVMAKKPDLTTKLLEAELTERAVARAVRSKAKVDSWLAWPRGFSELLLPWQPTIRRLVPWIVSGTTLLGMANAVLTHLASR